MKDVDVYSTKDFYQAAFLVARGHKVTGVDRSNPRQVFFAFEDFKGRDDLMRAFLFGKAVVEPQAFIAAIKGLKGLIHAYD